MSENKITEKKNYYLRLPRASTGFVVDHSLEPTPLTVTPKVNNFEGLLPPKGL